MALPIEFKPTRRDDRPEFRRRVEKYYPVDTVSLDNAVLRFYSDGHGQPTEEEVAIPVLQQNHRAPTECVKRGHHIPQRLDVLRKILERHKVFNVDLLITLGLRLSEIPPNSILDLYMLLPEYKTPQPQSKGPSGEGSKARQIPTFLSGLP